jgi:hypothetical protein
LQIMGRSIHAIRWAQARMAWCQALESRRASQGHEQRLTAAACRSREAEQAEEEITGWVFHIYPHLLLQHQIIDIAIIRLLNHIRLFVTIDVN